MPSSPHYESNLAMTAIERLRAELETHMRPHNPDACMALRALSAEWERMVEEREARLAKMAEALGRAADFAEAFASTVEHAEQCRDARGKGGQQVPYHGDFATVTPSTAGRLAWWARAARSMLATLPPEQDAALKGDTP